MLCFPRKPFFHFLKKKETRKKGKQKKVIKKGKTEYVYTQFLLNVMHTDRLSVYYPAVAGTNLRA
jgi:hypothetical protein